MMASFEQKKTGAEIQRQCDVCKEQGETVTEMQFCLDCREVYCKTCSHHHIRVLFKLSMYHRLSDIKDSSFMIRRPNFFKSFTKCPNHQEREVEILCKDHDVVFCVDCFNSSHKLCNICIVSSHHNEAAKLREDIDELILHMGNAITHLNHIKTKTEEINEEQKSINQLKNSATSTHNVSGVRKQIELENEDSLDEGISRVLEIKELIDAAVALLDTIRQHGSERQQFISAHLMKTKMEELTKMICEEDQCLQDIEAKITSIAEDNSRLSESANVEKPVQITVKETESDHTHRDGVTNYLRDSKLVLVEKYRVSPDAKHSPWFHGVSVFKDGRIILCDSKNKYLCLYNPVNRTMLKLELNRPRSATQIDETRIAVSIPIDKVILIVCVGNELRVEKTFTTQNASMPWSIAALTNGQIAVTWTHPPAFGVIDISGTGTEIVQKSYIDRDKNGRKFKSFYDLVVDEKRQHVIQPCNEDKAVYCFDFTGESIFRYTNPEITSQRGVALDNCGNIYLCDHNYSGSIHKLSPTGELISIIKEGVPERPLAISSDVSGTGLWVTNDSSPHKIEYFRLEQNTQGHEHSSRCVRM